MIACLITALNPRAFYYLGKASRAFSICSSVFAQKNFAFVTFL